MESRYDVRSSKTTIGDIMNTFNIDNIRQDFPALNQLNRNRPLVYLDNAATTQKPNQVIDVISTFYRTSNANVHRGIYEISERATEAFESARQKAADFIHAEDSSSIIFTRGTTEAINLVAYAWGLHNLSPGDEILVTEMEHHSNIIPWQLIARKTGSILRYIPINEDGTLNLENSDIFFTSKTKIVAVIHQSNVLGTINPVKEIIQQAKQVGAISLVDGAQSAPHFKVDVQEIGCDFFAFSGHKMVGPTGVGVLYGKRELLESMEPFQGGGEMIKSVTFEESTWNDVPWKFEAGTPNIAQAIGLGAAIDYLNDIGIDQIHTYEQELTEYALDILEKIPGIQIYGQAPNRGAVISFNVDGVHPHDMVQFLDQDGIAVRGGHHCAQPIMKKFNVSATTRASFYLYNTRDEIDHLVESINKTASFLRR